MSSFFDVNDDMKALRAHSLQIDAVQFSNKSFDQTSDENAWFDGQKPLTSIEPDDPETWKRLQENKSLRRIHWDINGKRDAFIAAKSASHNQKQGAPRTPIGQTLQVTQQVRFSIPGRNLTPDAVTYRPFTQHNEILAAALDAGKKQLEEAYEAYEQAYSENLMELEFGPSCHCNRCPWQHELHPSGTARRNREREQQGEDAEMVERDGAGA